MSNNRTAVEKETFEDCEESTLVNIAMQIILHAGNARTFAYNALEAAKKGDFATANACIKEADSEILIAHKTQTRTIQSAMSGESYDYSLLFSHAQDTLMTIISEIRMSKQLLDVLNIIFTTNQPTFGKGGAQ